MSVSGMMLFHGDKKSVVKEILVEILKS